MEKSKESTALVVVAIDGMVTSQTGVGNVVYHFFDSYNEIKNKSLWFTSRDVDLIGLTPKIETPSRDINLMRQDRVSRICEDNGGFLDFNIPCLASNQHQSTLWTGGDTGMLEHWHTLSLSLASYLSALSKRYQSVNVILHDAPFCLVRRYLSSNNITLMWMSHGLGKVFTDEWKQERQRVEHLGFPMFIKANDFFLCISDEVRNDLRDKYAVPETRLLDFKNEYHHVVSTPDQTSLARLARIKSKSAGRKIIFSWGRCCYQKGFDELVPSLNQFFEIKENREKYFCVLLMPTGTGESSYEREVLDGVSQIDSTAIDCITEFDEFLPSLVLSLTELDTVIFASRFEGFSLTCLEALAISRKETKIIYTDIPAYREVFDDVETAIRVDQFSRSAYFAALSDAKLIDRAVSRGKTRRSFSESYIHGFDQLAKAQHSSLVV